MSLLQEGQVVNIGKCNVVALIEIRTGAVAIQIVGIDEASVVVVGRVVDGVAIGIGCVEFKAADVVPERGFERVVIG